MTSKSDPPDKAGTPEAYLAVDYGRVSFLVPREFWEGSRYAPLAEVPLYDWESRLVSWFGLSPPEPFPLVLVASTSAWSSPTKVAWGEPFPERVGFRVSTEPRLVRLVPSQKRPLPRGLASFLEPWGFVGCHFPSLGTMGLFLNPEVFVRRSLEEEGRHAHPIGG